MARDGLAALHGDPKRAALGEEKFELAEGQAAADKQASNKESWQKTVLDSLVGQQQLNPLAQPVSDLHTLHASSRQCNLVYGYYVTVSAGLHYLVSEHNRCKQC